jgi:glycosyltransferase involved in cell wall biosynthesis
LKVTHVIAGSLGGGAARGAYWLHRSLLDAGVDSRVLTNSRETLNDETVHTVAPKLWQDFKSEALKKVDRLPPRLYQRYNKNLFSSGICGFSLADHSLIKESDIIHLHFINGLMKTADLRKLSKPVVWTLRDMWPLTGGCHYSVGCNRYMKKCGQCPTLGSTQTIDLSRLILEYKLLKYPKNLFFVGTSEWITECALSSTVCKDKTVHTIANAISADEFSPIDKKTARKILKIKEDSLIILLGSADINDFYKGLSLFLESIPFIGNQPQLLVFGDGNLPESIRLPVTRLGFLHDTIALRTAYSAADVFVAPSRVETFGKTLVEAMSCETPVVCFDATGPKDIVGHKISGYKAQPFDPQSLGRGINWILEQSLEARETLGKQARLRVIEKFNPSVIANQHKNMYEEILFSQKA